MTKGIFITGTDTNVGKTVISAGLMYLLRNSEYSACYFKPALSGAIEAEGKLIPGDTRFVKKISNLKEDYYDMTPFVFKTPVSPHLASKLENKKIHKKIIFDKFNKLKNQYDYIICEGAGGIIVPITQEGYMMYDLIKDLNMDVIITSRAGLGTINHTTLTVKYAESLGIKVKGIIINGYEKENICHDDNIEMIKKLTGVPILGIIPKMKDIDTEKLKFGSMKEVFYKNIDIKAIIDCTKEI